MTRSASCVRPQLVALAAALTIGAMAPASSAGAQPVQRSVRLLLVLSNDDAADGATMGLVEARRTAELLGNGIHATTARVPIGGTASAIAAPLLAADRYDVIVGGGSPDDCLAMAALARDARIVYVNAWCDDDALREASPPGCEGSQALLHVLHVAPSRRMRAAAVAAGAAASGAAAAKPRAVAWHPSLTRFGAGQVNDRYRLAYKRGMTERAWLGWAAIKLVTEVALRPGPDRLGAALLEPRPLDGHKGQALRVRGSDGQLLQPLYVVAAGADSGLAGGIIAEIANPVARESAGAPAASTGARCE